MPIPLGPFDLDEPIGKGGMGVVWRGLHREQRIPVAVKVLSPPTTEELDYRRAFHHEVRAVSALDHPSIILIFDHGEIPAETAAASAGRITAHAPYLVMEYAGRGTLRSYGRSPTTGSDAGRSGSGIVEPTGPTDPGANGPMGWRNLRAILLTLLDALAHAHARGVLHRDLKPDNVLIAGPDDLRPGIKLSDFGIARPLDDEYELEEKPVGTPQYMAPEQLRNDRDAFGPHTDLYALGHLGWRLATGRLVWHGLQGPSLMYAQLKKAPPPFSPQFSVPAGFETFLRTLLEKEPHDRYQRAADAALALTHLDESDGTGVAGELAADTGTLRVVIGGRGGDGAIDKSIRPPLPERFVSPRAGEAPVRLLGAGLGLFGLRPIPFVGREAELGRVWSELAKVHVDGRARVVVVRGASGVGKTRFVEWIAERAHELGGANILKASVAGDGTALGRLSEPLVRFLHAHPLGPAERERRYGEFLAGLQLDQVRVADAIGLLLDPEELELPEVQRWSVLRRTLELVSLDRPLVVCCDDVQDSPDVLKLARQLLATRDTRPAAILVLVSALDDTDESSELARHLEALETAEAVSSVTIGPFAGRLQRTFVRAIANLAPTLEAAVVERTSGNALHAVQLVSDWVDRSVLLAGREGYDRAAREEPEDIGHVWDRRIRSVVHGLEAPAMLLLERAAALGGAVDVFEWQVVCDDPEGAHASAGRAMFHPRRARLRNAIMEALFEKGLARPTETGFGFAHRDLRQALVARAKETGRFRSHALACASTLEHRATDATALRVAEFHVESGHPERALPLLFRAEAWQRRSLGPAVALASLDRIEGVLRGLKLPRTERPWAELWTRRAEVLGQSGDHAPAKKAAAQAHALAEAGGFGDLDARAAMVLGTAALSQGDKAEAERHWLRAVELLGPEGPVSDTVRAWHWLRRIAVGRRDRASAAQRGEEIRKAGTRARTDAERVSALLALAEHLAETGDGAEALARASEATELALGRRDLASAAKAWSLVGDVAERAGERVRAREAWMQAAELLDDLGYDRRSTLARCRWAFVECGEARWAAAKAAIEPALRRRVDDDPKVAAAVHGVLALCAAGRGQWAVHDRELDACRAVWRALGAHEPQFAAMVLLDADLCAKAGHRERERAALLLARDRLVALGDTASARGVVARLEALDR